MLFLFDVSYLGDNSFLPADLEGNSYRHLVFASEDGLRDLALSSSWAMDGTFKVVKSPFTQLFSIHCLVEANGQIRQFPSVFAIMSRRCRADYELVLR